MLTFHGQRQEISTRPWGFLRTKCRLNREVGSMTRSTFDHNSMSISPAVVLIITRPLVGRAIGMVTDVTRDKPCSSRSQLPIPPGLGILLGVIHTAVLKSIETFSGTCRTRNLLGNDRYS